MASNHSLTMALTLLRQEVCKRLDVIIEHLGATPVDDVIGTKARRKPLTAAADVAKYFTTETPFLQFPMEKEIAFPSSLLSSNPATPNEENKPKKRGRPPKNKEAPFTEEIDTEEDKPTATVSLNIYCCLTHLIWPQIVWCEKHLLLSILHDEQDFQYKETYSAPCALALNLVNDDELVAAQTEARGEQKRKDEHAKCHCLPWVSVCLFLFS